MCGIVGYIGDKEAAPLILEALEKLEYRGYDSAGMAIVGKKGLRVTKAKGRLRMLAEATNNGALMPGRMGIGHTRWATHGEPCDVNSHPHMSRSGRVALVHNGIIENYAELKSFLVERGFTFVSDTDTEVAVQLVDYFYKGDPVRAVREAVALMVGSYALAIVFEDYPNQLIAVKKDSPLIIGLGQGENFLASDIPAILKHTRDVFRLGENEMAVLNRDGVTVFDKFGGRVEKEITHVTWDADAAEKGGYAHFMIKEINEQPEIIRKTVHPRTHKGVIDLELKHLTDEDIRDIDRIYIVACGSAYHAGAIGRNLIEDCARVPVTLTLASEFRYESPIITDKTLTIVISQSGETLDTLFALREAKARGSHILSVVNVVGSTIASESDDIVYTWAGPEISVATTKAYSAQLTVMYLLALYIARVRGTVDEAFVTHALCELERVPELIERELKSGERLQHLASLYVNSHDVFYIGRNLDFSLALEGSLKLKEISYVHSEAYAAGELKHGPISLIEKGTLIIALCTYAPLREKMISNIREVKARGGVVLAIAAEDFPEIDGVADHVVRVPSCESMFMPSVAIVPMQLFAYYLALLKGCDIDKPRNLAKSVTVE